MPSIRAIPTVYSGVKFRSRLEARWAVAFDVLGIAWEYEPEGFVLESGEQYLPDFWLPTFDGGMYVEVKPTGGDTSKAMRFAEETKSPMWMCVGPYEAREYDFYAPNLDGGIWLTGHPNWSSAFGEDRMFTLSGMTDPNNLNRFTFADFDDSHYGKCVQAINAAKSHRFGT